MPRVSSACPGPVLSTADRAAIAALAAKAPRLTPAQREQLRPLLAGTIPVPAARQAAA